MTAAAPAPRRPSLAVTVLAWLGLISGFIVTVDGGSSLMVQPTLTSVMELIGGPVAIVSSFGLRFRREWARQAFIGVQVYALLGLAAHVAFHPGVEEQLTPLKRAYVPETVIAEARQRVWTLVIASAVAAALLDGLIIYTLCTRRVREEFAEHG